MFRYCVNAVNNMSGKGLVDRFPGLTLSYTF